MSEDGTVLTHENRTMISDLISVTICPRRYYFERGREIPVSERYIICKQVSIHPDASEEMLWDEIRFILPDICSGMRSYLSECFSLYYHAPHLSYTDTDFSVSSEKYGIFGLIDKYDAEKHHFSLVRCTKAPSMGCWPHDRMRIAACQICLHEQMGNHQIRGYVEYIPSGVVRFCEPQPRDRRALIMALKMVNAVKKGEFPRKPGKVPCSRCSHESSCNVSPRKLSDLL